MHWFRLVCSSASASAPVELKLERWRPGRLEHGAVNIEQRCACNRACCQDARRVKFSSRRFFSPFLIRPQKKRGGTSGPSPPRPFVPVMQWKPPKARVRAGGRRGLARGKESGDAKNRRPQHQRTIFSLFKKRKKERTTKVLP